MTPIGAAIPMRIWAHGVVVSHPLSMREALGSIPSVSTSRLHHARGQHQQGVGRNAGGPFDKVAISWLDLGCLLVSTRYANTGLVCLGCNSSF